MTSNFKFEFSNLALLLLSYVIAMKINEFCENDYQ